MTELEKLKIGKEVRIQWEKTDPPLSFHKWIDSEIARFEDPHAEAKRWIDLILSDDLSEYTIQREQRNSLGNYVRHLENELAHYKIQAQHAKEAAAEPLDPRRVLATAANVCDGSINFHNGTDQRLIAATAERLIWLCGIDAKPYEVKQ